MFAQFRFDVCSGRSIHDSSIRNWPTPRWRCTHDWARSFKLEEASPTEAAAAQSRRQVRWASCSGTAIDAIVARRLNMGDVGGHIRRALEHFPVPGVAGSASMTGTSPGRQEPHAPSSRSRCRRNRCRRLRGTHRAAGLVEVFLAKEGHDGPIGINYLEKIQLDALDLRGDAGRRLGGADVVRVSCGRSRASWTDWLGAGESNWKIDGRRPCGRRLRHSLRPRRIWSDAPATLPRPNFYAIVSSATLAGVLAKKASGRVDGFIVEGPTAVVATTSAAASGPLQLTQEGEPIYGEAAMSLTLPRSRPWGFIEFAGSYGDASKVAGASPPHRRWRAGRHRLQFWRRIGPSNWRSSAADRPRPQPTGLARSSPIRSLRRPASPSRSFGWPGPSPIRDVLRRSGLASATSATSAAPTARTTAPWGGVAPLEPTDDFVDKGGKLKRRPDGSVSATA